MIALAETQIPEKDKPIILYKEELTIMKNVYPKIASLNTEEKFLDTIKNLGISIPFDRITIPSPEGPLAQPFQLEGGKRIGNRFCIQPMEGWDGTPDGKPTEFTTRRWKNFGLSGAKLIWGGEAAAVTTLRARKPKSIDDRGQHNVVH